jgi:hypothetical protein
MRFNFLWVLKFFPLLLCFKLALQPTLSLGRPSLRIKQPGCVQVWIQEFSLLSVHQNISSIQADSHSQICVLFGSNILSTIIRAAWIQNYSKLSERKVNVSPHSFPESSGNDMNIPTSAQRCLRLML